MNPRNYFGEFLLIVGGIIVGMTWTGGPISERWMFLAVVLWLASDFFTRKD